MIKFEEFPTFDVTLGDNFRNDFFIKDINWITFDNIEEIRQAEVDFYSTEIDGIEKTQIVLQTALAFYISNF